MPPSDPLPRGEPRARTPPRGGPNRPGPWAGFSLLEALVVLAILAGLAAAVATRGTGPSDELLLTRAAAELRAEIARARLGAARGGASVTLSLPAADCEGEVKEVRIFANGTVEGATTCLVAGDRRAILRLDGLTGGLERVEDD